MSAVGRHWDASVPRGRPLPVFELLKGAATVWYSRRSDGSPVGNGSHL